MGHHYIPQKYLQGFADPIKPGYIWQYDKYKKCFSGNRALPIKDVSQKRNFYDKDTEEKLAELVESPANSVLKKLRETADCVSLNHEDRSKFSLYIAIMRSRTLGYREKAMSIAQQILIPQELHANMKAIEDEIRLPQSSKDEHYAIYQMNWCLVKASGSSFFLTSDEPVYCPNGVGNADSELFLPISSELALWASYRVLTTNKIISGQEYVTEFNKRTVANATQYLYYHENVDWIGKLANKQIPNFKQMKWRD